MGERKTKWVALAYVTALAVIYASGIDCTDYALCGTFSLSRHLLYHHFHASIWHLLCNAWCLLTIVFMWNTSLAKLCTAYIIASTYPYELFSTQPTVGISGLIYVLVGMYSLSPSTAKGKIRYNAYVLLTMSVGLLMPMISVGVHIYCYIAGCIIALLNYPFFHYKQKQL